MTLKQLDTANAVIQQVLEGVTELTRNPLGYSKMCAPERHDPRLSSFADQAA
jgi:hypothetical protein